MGDDNAVYTLECVNRRQLLGARALNERSLLIRGLPFLRTKTIDIYIDDLVILSILHFSDVHVDSSPIEVQRADALYDFLQLPTSASKSGSTLLGEFWRGRLDGVSGTLGFPLTRRVSLMLITMLVAAVGVNRTLLERLLEGCAFALAFRRGAVVSFDVSHTAAVTLSPSRRHRVNGALLDDLLLVTGLAALLLQTNLRAEPCEKLYATDASPGGAGLRCRGSLARFVRKQENACALIGKSKNHRATCTMAVQCFHTVSSRANISISWNARA